MRLCAVWILSALPLFLCLSLSEDGDHSEFQKGSELFQGDIVLTPHQRALLLDSSISNRQKRQAKKHHKWPNATVFYGFGKLSPQAKYMFIRGMKHISSATCIKFQKNEKVEARLEFILGSGCWSHIGRSGSVQKISIGPGCPTMGNAVHEISHALGFIHTMSRYDRDDYLNINVELMTQDDKVNYHKSTEHSTYNVIPFEYGSVLTYAADKINQPKDPKFLSTMGNRLIGFYDMAAINRHYDCKCPKDLNCKNGGYTNPANCSECYCPLGFGGILCDKAPKTFSKTLIATDDWKSHTISFGFEGLEDTIFIRSTLLITAPRDKTIQVQATKMTHFKCLTRCVYNLFEIKYMGDPRIINPLFCCNNSNGWNTTFTSKLNPTPVNIYSRFERVELSIRFRYINGSVEDLPKMNNSYDSYQYPV